MKQDHEKIRKLTQLALLTAIMLVMSFTPLGFIPLGFMNATTMHVPVIIGGCILGARYGGMLGGLFGLLSVYRATTAPTIISFVFTPFYSFNEQFSGGWHSLIVAIVPRILIGVIAGLVFQALLRITHKKNVALLVAGVVGSLVNTIGVMGFIYLLFGQQYADAIGQSIDLLLNLILGVVLLNGVPEACIAAALTLAIGKALLLVTDRIVPTSKQPQIEGVS